MMDRRTKLALWRAWRELNEIRARDGVPYTHQGHKASVGEDYFSSVVDELADLLGRDTNPWPPAEEAETRAIEREQRLEMDGVDRGIDTIEQIKQRTYECFMEDHEPKPWTAGRCAGYAGRGSLALHLFRCKRKDGHGLGSLFCKQHAKTGGY